MKKQDLISFVKNNDFAFSFNSGRDVCNTGINNYDLCLEQIIEAIENAESIEEADESTKQEFAQDTDCVIYQAGNVAIAYYE